MLRSSSQLLIALVIATQGLPTTASACNDAEQIFEVNDGNAGSFPRPQVSGSPGTGDIAIVWDQAQEVYTRTSESEPIVPVNQTQTGLQEHAAVSHDSNGYYWAVWRDVSNTRIVMRGFKPDGTPFTNEVVVDTGLDLYDPRIAHGPSDQFTVVWPENTTGTDAADNIYARRFDADGDPTSGIYRVNTFLDAGGSFVEISTSPVDGRTVILWSDEGNGGNWDIKAKGYEANGTIVIPEFTVNTPGGIFQEADISHDKFGNFWIAYTQFAAQNAVLGKLYDPNGNIVGTEVELIPDNVATLSSPAIDHHPVTGNFTVVYRNVLLGAWNRISGRCFFGDGTPNGPGFIVSDPAIDENRDPGIAYYNDTDFIVAWKGVKIEPRVYARAYTQTSTGVEPHDAAPLAMRATSQPTVFRAQTTIAYELPAAGATTLRIYDVSGRAVRTLLDGASMEVGAHQVTWDGRADDRRPVGTGTYFYKLDHGHQQLTGKMVRVR